MKIKKLIHKYCGGKIKITKIIGLNDGEGYCKRCKERIWARGQIDWEKSEVKDDGKLAHHL